MSELERVRELARAALQTLEASRRRIDDLNVYPVPDGDTGTNLTLTARGIVEALETSVAADRAAVAKELTRAALMGARGNSGVIFSQIVRGAAEVLGEDGPLDGPRVRRSFRGASDAAYRAVRRPVEGTMLTVIRELAEEAEDPRHASLDPVGLFKALLARGEDALARTPEQLAVLKEAGDVDAGGAGLLEILRGLARERRPRTHTRRASRRSTRSSPSSATAPSSSSRARTSCSRSSRRSSSRSATRCSSSATRTP